jgi:hypothetical protein
LMLERGRSDGKIQCTTWIKFHNVMTPDMTEEIPPLGR